MVSTAWAHAKLAVRDAELLEWMRPTAVLQIVDFNPQSLATTAWAWATLTWTRR